MDTPVVIHVEQQGPNLGGLNLRLPSRLAESLEEDIEAAGIKGADVIDLSVNDWTTLAVTYAADASSILSLLMAWRDRHLTRGEKVVLTRSANGDRTVELPASGADTATLEAAMRFLRGEDS